jgi:hypothetical protein
MCVVGWARDAGKGQTVNINVHGLQRDPGEKRCFKGQNERILPSKTALLLHLTMSLGGNSVRQRDDKRRGF